MNNTSILAYTGEFLDRVTGGYPLGNGYRTYLPELMRFNAPDDFSPFGWGGVNCYAYCAGDPVDAADPTGHMPMFDEFVPIAEAGSGRRNSAEDFEAFFARHEHESTQGAVSGVHGEGQGQSNSGTSLAAAHASSAHASSAHASSAHASSSHASNLGAPGVNDAFSAWLDKLKAPLRIDEIPTSDEALTKLFNEAVQAGQVTLNPGRQTVAKELFKWEPEIELNGEPLRWEDDRLAKLMRRYGASRGQTGRTKNRPFIARLEKAQDVATSLDIALGGWPTQGEFRPILLYETPSLHSHVPQAYTRAVRDRAKGYDQ